MHTLFPCWHEMINQFIKLQTAQRWEWRFRSPSQKSSKYVESNILSRSVYFNIKSLCWGTRFIRFVGQAVGKECIKIVFIIIRQFKLELLNSTEFKLH